MTVAEPVTASPPAKTPSIEVARSSSVSIVPFFVLLSSGQLSASKGPGTVPKATITSSQGYMNSLPSTGTGLRRPEASGSPSSILMHSAPLTAPFSPRKRTGLTRKTSFTPSSSACSISSLLAGISSRPLRYSMDTSSAPNLRAVRAASQATFPAPMTHTFFP